MKQTKIGDWPAMSPAAAVVAWEKLRETLASGSDAVSERKAARSSTGVMIQQDGIYTVRKVCNEYVAGHVEKNRKQKGAAEVARMFRTMLGDLAAMDATKVTRSMAFDLIESHSAIPVQAA